MSGGWIAVALSNALGPSEVLPAALDDHDYVLWRDENGQLHAQEDRCPHRGMRLRYGFVRGDRLACAYHGWQFDATGQCRHIPAHPTLRPTEAMKVRVAPVAESDQLIWLHRASAPGSSGSPGSDAQPGPKVPWSSPWTASPVRTIHVNADLATTAQTLEQLTIDGLSPGCSSMTPVMSITSMHHDGASGPAATASDCGPWLGMRIDTDQAGRMRGLGWALQPLNKDRTGVHALALAADATDGVDNAWRHAILRGLRGLRELAPGTQPLDGGFRVFSSEVSGVRP
jgi:nitrite reductase/ring-hydroxylating ferredoxin subunit